ncbi:MAG: putative carotenoid epsilon cyclase [Actinomycetota bacterium]|jgi:lycopene cyclase domain-containing protein
MTYGDMNLIFLVIAGIATWVIKSRFRCFTTPIVLLAMLILTAVFDNFIILAGIVDYDTTKLLGIYVGVVPIEDFAYTVVAVLLVPAIWKAVNKK